MLTESVTHPMPAPRVPPQPSAAGRPIPEELSCAEVLDRAVKRFGWPSVLHAASFVACSQAKDRLCDSINTLAEAEEQQ